MFQAVAREQRVFSALMAEWRGGVYHVDRGVGLDDGLAYGVSGNFFAELGIRPEAGRTIDSRDTTIDPPAAAPVVMLGRTFARRHFQDDAAALGRTITIENAPFTIVGVAPAGFTGFGLAAEPDLVIPLTASPLLSRRSVASLSASVSPSVRAVGRLRDGVTIEQARAQLTTMWPAVREGAMPAGYTGARRDDFLARQISVESGAKGYEPSLRNRYARPLVIVMSIAAVILLIACVNLASLVL